MSDIHSSKGDAGIAAPTSDRSVRHIGLLIVFVTFGLFGGWALLAPLNSAALAPGVVTVQNYRKTVQHLEGGIVKTLYARDGEQVKAGDPLIELDDTQSRAEYESVLSQLVAAQSVEARLLAERDQLEAIDFTAMAESDSPRATEARDTEVQVFNARRHSRLGEIDVLRQRVGQLQEQVKGLQELASVKTRLKASFADEVAELRELLKQGYIDKQRLVDQERRLDSLDAEVSEHRSEMTRIRLQINETELQILQLDKKFDTEVVAQLAETQTKVFSLRQSLQTLQDRIRRSIIRAPEDGMIIGMKIHTVGGVINPGTPLLDIVPSDSSLVIEAQVSPMDIDRIELGQLADVRFSAFNSATTPVIEGQLTRISGDRLINEHTGMPYYLVRVDLTEKGLHALGSLRLLPGMPAEVLINTGSRTLFQYLMQPATNAFARSLIEE